jgi:hypothetical protein
VPGLTTVAGVSPAVNVGNPNCHADLLTKATALGSYTIPKVDVLVSVRSARPGGAFTARNAWWRWCRPRSAVPPPCGHRRCRSRWKPGDVRGDRVNALTCGSRRPAPAAPATTSGSHHQRDQPGRGPTYNQNYNLTPATPAAVAGADGADAALREGRRPDRFSDPTARREQVLGLTAQALQASS